MAIGFYRERDLPYLTRDLPGVGGAIKRYDEDFIVEEMPRYDASGEGTHIYFQIEKRGLTTPAAIRLIAEALGRRPQEIGYAGLKDAHSVTRQMLSIEHINPAKVTGLDLARVRVVSTSRHTNKIKLGHLAGNRFDIKIRDTAEGAPALAEPIVERLTARGVPNYFGPQRFGVRGDNALVGLAVLRGDLDSAIALMLGRPSKFERDDVRRARELFDRGDLSAAADAWPRELKGPARVCRALADGGDPRKAWRAVDHSLRKLYFSAVQSELFNRVLVRRIDSIDKVQTGDVAWKHVNGACFLVEDVSIEQPRCEAFEISPTGPLFGKKMKEPTGSPQEIEQQALADTKLGAMQLRAQDGAKLDGARRPLRVPLQDPKLDTGTDNHGRYLRIAFALPPGSYATAVTREICKGK